MERPDYGSGNKIYGHSPTGPSSSFTPHPIFQKHRFQLHKSAQKTLSHRGRFKVTVFSIISSPHFTSCFFSSSFSAPTPSLLACPRCLRTGTEPRALIIMISCGALWLQLLRAEARSPASGAGRELGSNPWLSKTPPPYPKQNLVRIILPVFRTRQLAKHFVLHLRKTMNA